MVSSKVRDLLEEFVKSEYQTRVLSERLWIEPSKGSDKPPYRLRFNQNIADDPRVDHVLTMHDSKLHRVSSRRKAGENTVQTFSPFYRNQYKVKDIESVPGVTLTANDVFAAIKGNTPLVYMTAADRENFIKTAASIVNRQLKEVFAEPITHVVVAPSSSTLAFEFASACSEYINSNKPGFAHPFTGSEIVNGAFRKVDDLSLIHISPELIPNTVRSVTEKQIEAKQKYENAVKHFDKEKKQFDFRKTQADSKGQEFKEKPPRPPALDKKEAELVNLTPQEIQAKAELYQKNAQKSLDSSIKNVRKLRDEWEAGGKAGQRPNFTVSNVPHEFRIWVDGYIEQDPTRVSSDSSKMGVVAIVDDNVDTGHTVYQIAKKLYEMGAKAVVGVALYKFTQGVTPTGIPEYRWWMTKLSHDGPPRWTRGHYEQAAAWLKKMINPNTMTAGPLGNNSIPAHFRAKFEKNPVGALEAVNANLRTLDTAPTNESITVSKGELRKLVRESLKD